MKALLTLFALTFSGLASANEDHLLMIPTPIQVEDFLYIVNRPMISGYGADFESNCERIAAPYIGELASPSSEVSEVDMNPASVARIQLSVELPSAPEGCKVTIDYSNATDDSKKDVRLLRAILTCVYLFGDGQDDHPTLKVSFEITGIDAESALHAELKRITDVRKQQVKMAGQPDAGPPALGLEFKWRTH